MNIWRSRTERVLRLLALCCVALGLSGAPAPLRAEQEGRAYRLASAEVLNQALLRIINNYVDPGRIRPRMMLLKGLEWIQQSVAEVQVRSELPPPNYREATCQRGSDCASQQWPLSSPGSFECFEGLCQPVPDQLTVQVDTEARNFTTRDIQGPWDLSRRMREIFAFLDENLPEDVERPELEYAAINGILSTLDPHSNLLTPDIFEEMQLGTRGEFGGLGIVISMHPGPPCSGNLSVMEVMEGSPAQESGIRRMDRIIRIGEHPTACMDLNEAVSRMRGAPGTSVRIWIERAGEPRARPVDLVRARIQIDSVTSRMLPDGVGYVKVENFQVNTTEELRSQLAALRSQGMRSLILDLRDDPGGLLDQAIQVVDTFLSSGTIVITAGARLEERETRRAEAANTEPNYPLAVLINSGSASASEIVAGALRNQGRAILIGERTFGKGSVQTLYELDDGSALKLTVAQYLTPGDESIQSLGIVPDVEFGAMTVARDRIDLDPRNRTIRESDLEQHLEQQRQTVQEAAMRLWLLGDTARPRPQPQCPDVQRCDQERKEPWSEEAVTFAQQLLATQGQSSRASLLHAAEQLVRQRQEREMQAVANALRPFRVDWAAGTDARPAALQAVVDILPGNGVLRGGQQSRLQVRVTNNGPATVYRLQGVTKSDNPLLDDHELVFGRLQPGQSRTWEVPICVPAGATARTDPLTVTFHDQQGHVFAPAHHRPVLEGLEHPSFAYGVQLIDALGNGDGRLQRGEQAQLRIVLRNEGPGQAQETEVRLRSKAGDAVVLRSCRHPIGRMPVGGEQVVTAEIMAGQSYRENSIPLELYITDQRMREVIMERLEIPIAGSAAAPAPANGVVSLRQEKVALREAPSARSRVVASSEAGALFAVTAQTDDFLRLDLGNNRPAWVARSATVAAPDSRPAPRFTEALANRPPEIRLTTDVPLAVRGETLRIGGEIRDPDRVLDMYIFVGRSKPFYLSNRRGSDPHRLTFTADIPLEGGSNQVLIVARETSDLVSRKHLVIRRDNPDGTPIDTRETSNVEEEEPEL